MSIQDIHPCIDLDVWSIHSARRPSSNNYQGFNMIDSPPMEFQA